jgi:Tfp pilus assembly protein PilF
MTRVLAVASLIVLSACHEQPSEAVRRSIQASAHSLAANKYKDADELLSHALKQAPDNAEIYVNLGVAAAGQGDFVRAKRLFLRALEKDPGMAECYWNLHLIYQADKDRERDKQALRMFIKLADPTKHFLAVELSRRDLRDIQ